MIREFIERTGHCYSGAETAESRSPGNGLTIQGGLVLDHSPALWQALNTKQNADCDPLRARKMASPGSSRRQPRIARPYTLPVFT